MSVLSIVFTLKVDTSVGLVKIDESHASGEAVAAHFLCSFVAVAKRFSPLGW